MDTRPFVLAIAGPSCSGKTSLARRVAERIPESSLVVELDWYYRDQAGRSLDEIDVDVPAAIDDALLVDHLRQLVDGRAVDRPVYDYATHARAVRTVRVGPARVVVVEGLFALYWEPVRRLLDASVFILADHGTCLARRIARDTRERGRTIEQVMRQYDRRVKPMYEEHVHPTRLVADLLLSGAEPIDALTERVLALIRERRRGE